MIFSEALAFLTELAKLGASPAVQEFAHRFVAKQSGLPPEVVTAAVKAQLTLLPDPTPAPKV